MEESKLLRKYIHPHVSTEFYTGFEVFQIGMRIYQLYLKTFKNFRRIIYNVQMTLRAIEVALINLM